MNTRLRSAPFTAIVLVAGLGLLGIAWAQRPRPQAPTAVVEVFKSPTCGCCSKWVEHLQAHGFTVKTTNVEDIYDVKTTHRVPAAVESCHTALVGGYVVEGHVPASDVQKLLKERPAIAGIGVRGMPIGSPGMEVEGVRPQPYTVLAFDKAGQTRAFSTH
jgi:hypothetical protein